MKIRISFAASGYVGQTIEMTNPEITPQQLIDGLNSGLYVTTIQEDGSVDITKSGESIGRVVDVDNCLEYEEFELND